MINHDHHWWLDNNDNDDSNNGDDEDNNVILTDLKYTFNFLQITEKTSCSFLTSKYLKNNISTLYLC